MSMIKADQRLFWEASECPNEAVAYARSVLLYSRGQIEERETGVALYRDAAKRLPIALLRTDGCTDVLAAVEDARQEGFEFVHLWPGGKAMQLGADVGEWREVPAVPTWTPGLRRSELVSRDVQLLPFRTEEDLRRAFKVCHDLIYKHLARDPAASFDLLALLIAAKVEDELAPGGHYEFGTVEGELPTALSERLTRLVAKAHQGIELRNDEVHVLPTITLDAELSAGVARALQDWSLTSTAHSIAGADALGTAYEAMVGATFRGELGAYFTPRRISDFIVRILNVKEGRVFDPACGTGGLLIAAHRFARAAGGQVACFGNDINPRMVHTARVNFLLHDLDRQAVTQGDGLDLGRMVSTWFGEAPTDAGPWWDVVEDGPFDAVVANPPFAGHEQDELNLSRIATSSRKDGGVRALNRTIPFLEVIVASLRQGGVAGIVLPTSVLNAEEESFVRFRDLLLNRVEVRAIIGLPERAFVHTDCGVHGALLFIERSRKPREDYDVFVAWADHLGYDRLGRDIPENDLPDILRVYHSGVWPEENSVSIRQLREWGRLDPAWIRVAGSLPTAADAESGAFVRLTEIVEVRDARISRRSFESDASYRFFEVADTDLATGRIRVVHSARGWELQRKSRIKNQVRSGDILLPNHRDSLIARGAETGRSAVVVTDAEDGVLTTDRFIVLRPLIDPRLVVLVLNSAGVRRQLVAQTRGAASLDVRERTLESVLVPRSLVSGDVADQLCDLSSNITALRAELAEKVRAQRELVESAFGASGDFRPAASGSSSNSSATRQ